MKIYLYLFVFLLIYCLSSCHRGMNHDAKVFIHAANMLGLTIPDEPHSFIFITTEGCTGCKPLAFARAQTKPSDSVTFVTTPKLMKLYSVQQQNNIVVDSAALIERLNWSLHGIIEVCTANGKVVRMCDYDSKTIMDRCPIGEPVQNINFNPFKP